jgi:hypothetical protein
MPRLEIYAALLSASLAVSACAAAPDTTSFLAYPTSIVQPKPVPPDVAGPSSPTVGPQLSPMPPASPAGEGLPPRF